MTATPLSIWPSSRTAFADATTLLSIGIQPVAELVLGALCLHLLPETSSAAPSPRSVLAFCLLALTVVAAWFSTLHTGTTNAFIYFQF
jgi:hypothetical protein